MLAELVELVFSLKILNFSFAANLDLQNVKLTD